LTETKILQFLSISKYIVNIVKSFYLYFMLKSNFSNVIEAGCDEAGRGCLAGPVFASAVILPPDFFHSKLNDSKQINEKTRFILRDVILKESISWAVAQVDHVEIDKINILNASILAMHKALRKLDVVPEHIIIDGNRFKKFDEIPYKCIVKGDSLFSSIAAASILAKTFRDDFMMDLHQKYPQYSWNKNKGYPTKEHRKAIHEFGITDYHRKSFKLVDNYKLF